MFGIMILNFKIKSIERHIEWYFFFILVPSFWNWGMDHISSFNVCEGDPPYTEGCRVGSLQANAWVFCQLHDRHVLCRHIHKTKIHGLYHWCFVWRAKIMCLVYFYSTARKIARVDWLCFNLLAVCGMWLVPLTYPWRKNQVHVTQLSMLIFIVLERVSILLYTNLCATHIIYFGMYVAIRPRVQLTRDPSKVHLYMINYRCVKFLKSML